MEDFGIPAISFNPRDQKLYWFEEGGGGVFRSSPGGEDIQRVIGLAQFGLMPLVDHGLDAHAIVFDGDFLYWGNWIGEYQVGRVNLVERTDVETIVESGDGGVNGLAIDSQSGALYWTEQLNCGPGCTGALNRAALDGSDVSVIAQPTNPRKVALDGHGYLYWVNREDFGSDNLYRSQLDGSEAAQIISDVSAFALDLQNDRIIFARNSPGPDFLNSSALMRASRSGGDIQEIVTLPFRVRDIALRATTPIPEPPTLALLGLAAGCNCLGRRQRQQPQLHNPHVPVQHQQNMS